MVDQPWFLDLSAKCDDLERAAPRSDASKGGRSAFDILEIVSHGVV